MQKKKLKLLKKASLTFNSFSLRNFLPKIILAIVLLSFCNLKTDAQGGKFDARILRHLEARRTPSKNSFYKFVSKWNNPVCLAAPAGLLVAGVIRNDVYMKRSALYVVESIAISSLVNLGLKKIFKRKRPFSGEVTFTAVVRPTNESFPSGHTAEAFSMATSMTLAYPKWYVIVSTYGWASLVGYSRMYLGVHYPTDVIAGAGISSTMSWLTYKLNRNYLNK